jgi:hypothetical protein
VAPRRLGLIVGLLLLPTQLSAQSPWQGAAANTAAAAATVTALRPSLARCSGGAASGTCVRVPLQIRSASGPVSLSYLEVGNGPRRMGQTDGLTAGGAYCFAAPLGDLPMARLFHDELSTFETPWEIAADQPTTAVIEFKCDQDPGSGDAFSFKLTLVVAGALARYQFAEQPIR